MANVVTIDIVGRFVDNVTDESKSASKAIEGIGKEADKLNKKKAKPSFDADDNLFLKKIRNMEAKMNKMGHTKTAAVLDLVDKASSKLMSISNTTKKVTGGLENLTKRTWTAMVRVKDMALAPIKAIKNALFSIPTLITAVVSAKVVQKAVLEPINLADQYSGAKIGFETLFRSESAAQKMMDDIDTFAKKTPFKTSGVISNVQKMMAYGWDTDRLLKDMEILGDAAAATGKGDEGLGSIVYALSEIRSKGKLSTQELNQLASAGIKAKAYLAEGLGFGTDDAGMKKLAEALEDGAVGANQAIDLILEGMKEFDGMMDKTANETVGGLKSQLEDVFEINIARKWGQGLQAGAKRGLGTLVSLLDGASDSLSAVGDMLYEIGEIAANWVADKLEVAVKKIKEITGSYEFKNASTKDKISMLWNGVVADPVKEWWEGGGRDKVIDTAADVGKAIAKAIWEGIKMAWDALPGWGKLLVGGYAAGKTVSGIGNVIGGFTNLLGGLGSAGGYINAGAGWLKAPGTGFLGGLSKIGYSSLGSAGVGVSGGMAALAGGVKLAGLAGAVVSTGHMLKTGYDAISDFKKGDKASGWANTAKAGSTAIGLGVGALGAMGLAAKGAAIGTFFGGPIGTAVGAGLGGLVGMFAGDKIARHIQAAKYEHEGLNKAIKDGEDEAKVAAELEKALWEDSKKRFKGMKLSTEEIQRLSNQIIWGDDLEKYEQTSSAIKNVEANLQAVKTASQDIDKWMWKAGLGVKFNADEMEAFALSVNDYISSAKTLLTNKHYEFTSAMGFLFDPESDTYKSIIKDGNAYYAGQQEQLDKLTKELSEKMQKALEDGVVSIEPVKLPDGTLGLSEQEEITNLQEQITSIIEQAANNDFEVDLEAMKIKWGSGKLDAESFDKFLETGTTTLAEKVAAADEIMARSLDEAMKIYANDSTKLENAKTKIAETYFKMIEDAGKMLVNSELDILGDAFAKELGTNAATDLRNALDQAIKQGIEPIEITDKQLAQWLDVKEGDIQGVTADNIRRYLQAILDQLESSLPDDIKKIIGIQVTANPIVTNKGQLTNTFSDQGTFGLLRSYGFDTTLNVTGQQGTITPFTIGPSSLVNLTSSLFKPRIDVHPVIGSISEATIIQNKSYPWIQKYRGGIIGGTSAMEAFALGGRPDDGMLKGSTRFISVNEEYPEMIIPLSSQRRARAMKLWTKTGSLLGVPGFARGGITSGGQDEGLRFKSYGSNESVSGQSVQIDIGGLTFDIKVNGNDPKSITTAIKEQAEEIAEVVAGVLADALGAQFENTPARGGVA